MRLSPGHLFEEDEQEIKWQSQVEKKIKKTYLDMFPRNKIRSMSDDVTSCNVPVSLRDLCEVIQCKYGE